MSESGTLKRILFIDDEPALLDSLRRVLRSLRNEWDVQVESSPERAIERIDREGFDVVVSDMRMPGIDGVGVLTHVMHKHPDTIRLMLSGHSELEAAIRAVSVAHQFLAKPCDPAMLKDTIQRISRMRDRLADEKMRALVGEIDGLPALPTVCRELNQTLARDDFSIRDVSLIVEKDPALCAKILQLTNSSFFGIGRRLTHVHDAVSYLGTSMLKSLVMSATLWRELEAARPDATHELSEVLTHCQTIAVLSRRMLAKDRARSEEAFVCGLLHDVGVTLLIAYLPERFAATRALANAKNCPFSEAERALFEVGHADVGAYLLDAWGLPFAVLEAVYSHHEAPALGHTRLEASDAVFIAQAMHAARATGRELATCVDAAYLAQLGVSAEFEEWKLWFDEPAEARKVG